MRMMIAARLHAPSTPLRLDTVPLPEPRLGEVLIQVKACNLVPNLKNVLGDWERLFPYLPLPKLPAIFGLDAAGVVAETGPGVLAIRQGDRVYVNPGRGCGSCKACRTGDIVACESYSYQGYFGRGPQSQRILELYPYGGMAEYMIAPQWALVKLPENVSFEAGARFGYLGTAYTALRKAGVGPAKSVLINGIGGTLGLGGALLALAMGATRILGTGRNRVLLERVKALAPKRIEVFSVHDGSVKDWAFSLTEGEGVDAVIDTLPPRTPSQAVMEALRALRVGGKAVDVGGSSEALVLDGYWLKQRNITLAGARGSTTQDGEDIAEMARAGTLDLGVFEHRRFPLAQVNEAVAATGDGSGGFSNFVVIP